MIVDFHTHVGAPEHFFGDFAADSGRAWGDSVVLGGTLDEHWSSAAGPVDRCVVLAFAAPAAGYVVPNEYVAEYVARDPEKLVGFGSIDPGSVDAMRHLEELPTLGLRGLKLAPIYQHISPLDSRTLNVVEGATDLGLPILFHMGTTFLRNGDLNHARPITVDEIARRFPEAKIVIAHLGHPWIGETLAVIRKHPNVYADVSALFARKWQLYNALISAMEYRVTDKLIFGTDYPFDTFVTATETLRSINDFTTGTSLPRFPERELDSLLNRDSLALVGIPTSSSPKEK